MKEGVSMTSIPYSVLRRGMHIVRDSRLYLVVDHEARTHGNLSSTLRIWLKNHRTGAITDHRVHPEERVEEAFLERRPVTFLYRIADRFVFMDDESFDQHELRAEFLGDQLGFVNENQTATLVLHNEKPIALELPPLVELTVRETEPGVRSATASAAPKPAILETGLRVTIPQFVKVGDVVVIDTRTAEYAGRVR
jgi:elongation factor P